MDVLRSLPGTTDFWFMRHGESEGNREGVMQGRTPSRLTPRGREQARAAGAWFRGKGVGLVLASPLTRAFETAELAAEAAGAPAPVAADELVEIDTGMFTGLTFVEARDRHPREWARFQAESWEGVEGSEKIDQLLERAGRLWALLAARAAAGVPRILCVTHSGFLQWVIRATFGGRSWMPLFPGSGNCGVSHLRVTNTPQDGSPAGHMATWLLINAPVGAAENSASS